MFVCVCWSPAELGLSSFQFPSQSLHSETPMNEPFLAKLRLSKDTFRSYFRVPFFCLDVRFGFFFFQTLSALCAYGKTLRKTENSAVKTFPAVSPDFKSNTTQAKVASLKAGSGFTQLPSWTTHQHCPCPVR